jgi:hypothetical protein
MSVGLSAAFDFVGRRNFCFVSTVCHCTYSSERQNQQPAEQRALGINFSAVGQFLVGTSYPKGMFMFDDGGSELDCEVGRPTIATVAERT